MDILNFISWIKGSRVFTTVDPNKTLLPVGIKDNKRGDDYLAGAISVADFITQIGPGQVGPQGPQGVQGVQGIQGNQGLQGNQGIQGNTGAQGTAGNSVTILGSVADLAAFLIGPGASPGANIGDAWILLSDGSLMTWNGTIWFDAGDIQGPPGATGATGATGAQGVQGNQGIQGVQGVQGIQGPAGLPGLFAQTADSTPVTATIVESSLIGTGVGTLTVPANGFSIGDSFTAFFDGRISCVGTATLHIKVKTLTGVLLADTGIIAMDAATDHNWKLDLQFTIRTLGTTGVASISSGGLFGYIKNSGNNYEGYVLSTVNNTTFNTTINNTLIVTAQWNTTNAGNSIFSRNFTLTKVY
jgi:hypothetical protein